MYGSGISLYTQAAGWLTYGSRTFIDKSIQERFFYQEAVSPVKNKSDLFRPTVNFFQ
jgi:hypothetical protein